ncbi:MAG: tRNA glutamyl-Q(34) synthetase GluQRS [Cycloclasticus sp.]|nr:tRNA glutamyl-Q(34) synthetase GluQRS [Cycloclasticus sp.]MBQ0789675.1 tRNA glutamyl-Q(34) synthetase GluQRS [Cycloclasticus sp.]
MSTKGDVYRGRFAPSPTGPLHFGSLYTAVASFLQARASGGKWLIRIDDLDPFRCRPAYATQILKTLEQYGLIWDESVLYQSTRQSAYKIALDKLGSMNYLYPCSCSRKDLIDRGVKHGVYDQYCLQHKPDINQPHAIRIRLSNDIIEFSDTVQGTLQYPVKQNTGDFVIFRKDQVFAYHLAVVLDDDEQGITHVLRGHDLIDSTAQQLFLQQLLGIKPPIYAHIPVISDAQGIKLSKQTYAEDISLSPVRDTLISTLAYLNLKPPAELFSCHLSDILDWGVEHWSNDLIKRQDAIIMQTY